MTSMKRDTCFASARFTLIGLLLFNQAVIAQDAPRFTERIDVSLVNVDVIVTDRNGNRVRGLKAEDFTLTEEGKRQEIVNFAEYAAGADTVAVGVEGTAPKAATAEAPPRQPRTVLVFVDELALIASKADFRPAINEVFTSVLQEGDTGAVMTWTNRLNIRQGFTDDRGALVGAVQKLPAPGPYFTVDSALQLMREDNAYWQSLASDPMNSTMIGDEGALTQLLQHSLARTTYIDIKSKVRAINAAMTAVAGAEGRKVLVLVTHRLSRIAGYEYMLGVRAEAAPIPTRAASLDTRHLIESIAETANATGFTVYGLFPEGLRASMDSAQSSGPLDPTAPPIGVRDHLVVMNETATLDLISDRTGGDYAIGTDVLKLLPQVTEDLTDYYSIAYRTEARGSDNTRDISVRVKNRNYVVRARSQYAERSDSTRMKDRVTASVFAQIDPGVIPIQAELATLKNGKLPLAIRIPISALTTIEKGGKHTGAFTVYLAWNSSGTVNDVTKNTQPFTIEAADLERAKGSHFTYNYEVRVDSATRALGIGVLDETSKEFGAVTVNVPQGTQGHRLELNSTVSGVAPK